MKCYSCKATIPDGATVCPTCGKQQGFDAKTIRAASRGDEAALTELYEKTYSSVYNTIKFMVRDDDAALDILQDSYVKAFRSLDTLQDPARFGAWVRRIAHNRAIDYLRKAKPVSLSSLVADESGDEVELEDDRTDNLPEAVIDQKETARLLGEILDALPDDQRVCVTMYYYDQLSVHDIAEELDVSEATVKSRLMYGRKKIEQQVKSLERRGVKLYGMAPAALLMWLFQAEQAQVATLPAAGVLQAVLGEAGLSSAAATAAQSQAVAGETAKATHHAAATTAAGAGSAAATAAGMSLTTKVVAVATAIVLVAGGAAFAHFRGERPADPASHRAYYEVTSTYLDRLEASPEAFLESYDAGYDHGYDGQVNNELLAQHFRFGDDIWYGFADLNGDGVDEMMIGTKGDDWTRTWDIYTQTGGVAVPLFTGDATMSAKRFLYATPDGTLYILVSDGPNDMCDGFFRIAEDCSGVVPVSSVDLDQSLDPLSWDGIELNALDGVNDEYLEVTEDERPKTPQVPNG